MIHEKVVNHEIAQVKVGERYPRQTRVSMTIRIAPTAPLKPQTNLNKS